MLLVIGLLLGGVLAPLSTQVDNERRKTTSGTLRQINDALLGFAVANGRLPCPDGDGDGLEDACPPNPGSEEGDVPWATLDVGREDAWGHRIRYRVDSGFVSAPIPDPPNTVDGLIITDSGGATLATSPVAIVFSCGGDGLPNGGNDANGAADNPICVNPGTPDATYVQDVHTDTFDDILIWISRNSLLNRLVAAGRWP